MGSPEAAVEQRYGLHAAHQHERKQSGHARPDDVDKDPAVQQAEKNPDQPHAERRQRLDRRQLTKAEHDQQAKKKNAHNTWHRLLPSSEHSRTWRHPSFDSVTFDSGETEAGTSRAHRPSHGEEAHPRSTRFPGTPQHFPWDRGFPHEESPRVLTPASATGTRSRWPRRGSWYGSWRNASIRPQRPLPGRSRSSRCFSSST